MKIILVLFLLISSVSNINGHTIMGFQLPARSSGHTLLIAGIEVESASIYGCKAKLERILRGTSSKSSLIYDPTCEVLLLPKGSELEAVDLISQAKFPGHIFSMTCDNLFIELPPNEFSSVHSFLESINGKKVGNPGQPAQRFSSSDIGAISKDFPKTKECKKSGKVCISEKDVSFFLSCGDKGEVTVSTTGKVEITLGGSPISITVGK